MKQGFLYLLLIEIAHASTAGYHFLVESIPPLSYHTSNQDLISLNNSRIKMKNLNDHLIEFKKLDSELDRTKDNLEMLNRLD